MAILDCKRLKVPDTGIYDFCGKLAAEISKSVSEDTGLEVFLKKGVRSRSIRYRIMQTTLK